MRRRTWVAIAVAAAALPLALVATHSPAAPHVPASGPWFLSVQPTRADIGRCVADPVVEHAITPLPLPPAPTTVAFVTGAERHDVHRVVQCLVSLTPRPRVEVGVA